MECILKSLVQAADGDIERAEMGIVYIDEIDKCSRKGESRSTTADPSHEDLQQGLLKFIEGNVIDVVTRGARHNPDIPSFKMNTENILFIVGGAFEGIESIIKERQKKSLGTAIGFGSKINNDKLSEYNELISNVKADDFKKFGMLPELLGRLPVICSLNALSEEELIKILVEPKNSIIKQYQTIFAANNSELMFSEEALHEIAKKAVKLNTGARSLRGILESMLTDTMYNLPDIEGNTKVIVDISKNDDNDVNFKIDILPIETEIRA